MSHSEPNTPAARSGPADTAAPLALDERNTLAYLEGIIEKGLQTFRQVGEALAEIQAGRLYRQSHATFEAYLADRWQLKRGRAYQLIDAAATVAALPDEMSTTVDTERKARALKKVEPGSRAEVLKKAIQATGGKPPTAKAIEQAAREVAPLTDAEQAELAKHEAIIAGGVDTAREVANSMAVAQAAKAAAIREAAEKSARELVQLFRAPAAAPAATGSAAAPEPDASPPAGDKAPTAPAAPTTAKECEARLQQIPHEYRRAQDEALGRCPDLAERCRELLAERDRIQQLRDKLRRSESAAAQAAELAGMIGGTVYFRSIREGREVIAPGKLAKVGKRSAQIESGGGVRKVALAEIQTDATAAQVTAQLNGIRFIREESK